MAFGILIARAFLVGLRALKFARRAARFAARHRRKVIIRGKRRRRGRGNRGAFGAIEVGYDAVSTTEGWKSRDRIEVKGTRLKRLPALKYCSYDFTLGSPIKRCVKVQTFYTGDEIGLWAQRSYRVLADLVEPAGDRWSTGVWVGITRFGQSGARPRGRAAFYEARWNWQSEQTLAPQERLVERAWKRIADGTYRTAAARIREMQRKIREAEKIRVRSQKRKREERERLFRRESRRDRVNQSRERRWFDRDAPLPKYYGLS